MDDQGATKVIAAIERLSNRIAKLDETSVEAAAIANEARRAAMDAAAATNPKQIAAYVQKAVSPTMHNVAQETREVHKEILNGSWRATHGANELRKSYEEKFRSIGRQEDELRNVRGRYRFNAFLGALAGAIMIDAAFWIIEIYI